MLQFLCPGNAEAWIRDAPASWVPEQEHTRSRYGILDRQKHSRSCHLTVLSSDTDTQQIMLLGSNEGLKLCAVQHSKSCYTPHLLDHASPVKAYSCAGLFLLTSDCLLCSRFDAKCLVIISSLNPYSEQFFSYYYPHFIDKKTGTEKIWGLTAAGVGHMTRFGAWIQDHPCLKPRLSPYSRLPLGHGRSGWTTPSLQAPTGILSPWGITVFLLNGLGVGEDNL